MRQIWRVILKGGGSSSLRGGMTHLNNLLGTIFTRIDKENVVSNSAEIIWIFVVDDSINAYLTEKSTQNMNKIYADLKNSNIPIEGQCKEKKEEIWLSPVTNAYKPTQKSKKQCDNTKNATKTLITKRLRTDIGRSVGVTVVTPLVWLNRFTSAQPSHSSQK